MDARAETNGELTGLEEVDRQSTRHRRGGAPYGLSPNFARASASREKKPPAPKPAIAKPLPELKVVRPAIEITGKVLATCDSYSGLQAVLRARVDEVGFSREVIDHLGGLQDGYAGKVLGPAQIKKLGKTSLGAVLGVTGSFLALVENPEQLAKLKAVAGAVSAFCAVAALGVTRDEFERLAGTTAVSAKSGIGALGDVLASAGCTLALIEDPDQTEKMMKRAKTLKRRR